ncbi:MAG: hypothetical protein K9N47_11710 [Prosthecobacter sp.]|uniref:hypothetical protein n=1 Tax=Prosthecobacter sp. TaxID=1965333 RepID=UPI0025ED75CD|nr:hypothetical protein [Prosthecobacter sp.]MCF7786781.1 hypothetical protein [Prosthecobacter sp.]
MILRFEVDEKGATIGDSLARALHGLAVLKRVSALATPFVYWNRLENADFNNVFTVKL